MNVVQAKNHITEIWMISNRQPWPEALVRGLIRSKTRSWSVALPPIGSMVYLHASKALWSGWRDLWWVEALGIDVPQLPRGGVVAVAYLADKGPTKVKMPFEDEEFFRYNRDAWGTECADQVTMIFEDIKPIPFIPCRGAQAPTRKLPPELRQYIERQWVKTSIPSKITTATG